MSQINLTNQFGETSLNQIQPGGDFPALEPIANNTVLANISGGLADAAAVTLQNFSNILPAKAGIASITAIADPGTATAEDCADKINEILAALKVTS